MNYSPGNLFHGTNTIAICIYDKGKVKFWLVYNKNTGFVYVAVIK